MLQQPHGKVNRRPYASRRRDQQARETRQAILEAALEFFTNQGFHQTSVKQIAERAGVSEQTVYNAFGDKVGLLWNAGMMFMSAGGDANETALLEALQAEPDPVRRIRMVARDSREFWAERAEAILQLERLGFDPELRDPRLKDLAEKGLAYKLASTRAVCEILFPDGVRRADLDLDDIVKFFTAVDSAAIITTLRNLGWDMEQWERWIVQLLTLFLDPTRRG
ncbi:MAG: TetR/AcrR family transcriptional regulator [Chloroflexi bacterium]|nr:TetR/AcrR family transcriptional regulator [Chloroflexota bacterium]